MGICTSNQREHHHDGGTNRYVAPIAEEATRPYEPIRSNRRPATAAMSVCENLPQELIMAIAGNIRDDQKSLKAFSLVCKAWTNPAREHLFASLSIYDMNKRLEKMVTNITSTYTPFLRHLSLRSISPEFWHGVIPFLVDFRTSRLRSLDVKYLAWHSLSPDERSTFIRRFDSITSLRLCLYEQDKPNDIATIICSFPHLHALTLEPNWDWDESPGPFPLSPELPLPKRLSVLHLLNFCEAHHFVLEWLGSNPEQFSIHTFRVTMSWFFPRSFDAINAFLKTLGPSLEIFECNLSLNHLFVDLTHNAHLRCIDFRFGLFTHRGTEMLSAISILSRIRSRQLKQVALHFGSSWIDNFLHTEWIKLDTMLASSQFTALKSVRISGTLSPYVSFATLLPTCHARGIISSVDPPSW